MGSLYLSQYVAGNLSDLSPRAFRVICRMALVVLDEDSGPDAHDEGLYYGGWKGLTAVLGFGIYDRDDTLPPHVERAIARAVAELREAKLIEPANRSGQHGHWNKVYRLNLSRVPIV